MSSQEQQAKPFILTQLEEALEERQKSDRRKEEAELSQSMEDRRKSERRTDD